MVSIGVYRVSQQTGDAPRNPIEDPVVFMIANDFDLFVEPEHGRWQENREMGVIDD